MDQKKWKSLIKRSCQSVGTYQKAFDPLIQTLAEILTKRDQAEEMYQKSGASPIVMHTNKAGASNIEQNPALRLINDLNRDALNYWRELGLTPAGLKRINENAMKETKLSPLEEVLHVLES